MKEIKKEFKPSSWAIDNKVSIFILTVMLTISGILAYQGLPKESFPDISLPNIYVSVVHPGTSPKDMENLIVRPIEKECKNIAGVKKIKSSSLQDYCNVVVEFGSDVKIDDARQKVKDAVDRAKRDLPKDLKNEPEIIEINFADLPIMQVNISGDYDLNKLKQYADDAKDYLESMKEIKKVEMIGALEREIQINVDMLKMQAVGIGMGDIARAVQSENLTIPGGSVNIDGVRRSLSVSGEFKNVDQVANLVINSIEGKAVYLKDIAEVKDSYREQESYARLDKQNVITLNVIKRKGENLIEASDKISALIKDLKENKWPKDIKVTLTGDQSAQTRLTLHDLINTIIIGFVLVFIILMFFMGATNAFFVAASVPLSMFLAFIVMPTIGFTLNMIVLFSFLLALGIVVDDAIVVIENTHRIFSNGKKSITEAAKLAAGEVFLPVLSGTLTTLAPFIPLLFWKGIIGKFMFFLPVTLIVTLMGSLVVAYIINPVFAAQFMRPHNDSEERKKKSLRTSLIFFGVAIVFGYLMGRGTGNFAVLTLLLFIVHKFWLQKIVKNFQIKTWPAFQERYKRALVYCLHRPWKMMFLTVGIFFLSIFMLIIRNGGISFFPVADPNFIYVYTSLPVGTDQAYTDSITKIVEDRVYKTINWPNPIVKSVIANVTVSVTDPSDEDQNSYPNKSKVSVAFVEYGKRNGESTAQYLDKIREAVKGIPGAEITVAQEQGGPPVGKPVNIEVSGDNYEDLVSSSKDLKRYLDSLKIDGVEELRSDLQDQKPQVVFNIDRERANREGISTYMIGNEIFMGVLGADISKYRDLNDDHNIVIKYKDDQRYNVDMLRNLKILYRDMNMGGIVRNVPLSSFAEVKYSDTYGIIKRKNQKRVVTISSNVLGGYNENEVVQEVQKAINSFGKLNGVNIEMTGSQEEQAETSAFLGWAMMASLLLIVLILVLQFNSVSKPIIILTEIVFSIIGVFIGFSLFKMEFSIVMSGVGIIALAGIVVRNGILLVEFTDLLREKGVPVFDSIAEAGKTRMTPVILTALAAILGLIPLAVGLNIDFEALFRDFKPGIYFGGDNTAFWGPLSWTMIFGLGFATFLTLFMVPVMYLISEQMKNKLKKLTGKPVDKGVAAKKYEELMKVENF
ncbi:MAG: AcrB/AcrD/AcrF family protein [Bacteroidetes bacterium]|nr:MAG: AcrB/AcrD/AcrF family protein [Bacteroidota bacterium]REK33414.1 MAG: AcrB/AcrD/AcrF family protein [Bacteroidota bacterium]REK49813.1 MAG: AcrB/AcrD/AcrF family protein [Bacteroidota bacterium]